ncbi:MAG: hypothetical protein HC796_07865 [Synechococcaceae cyanobacterium RL_1_2]|nr:hypothetical protein [Synechococcaceae cyanobacterium RL_1_2]
MVKFGLTTVIGLFILIEIFLWLKTFINPLPLYIFAGAFLAIASNYDKGMIQGTSLENLLRSWSSAPIKPDQSSIMPPQTKGKARTASPPHLDGK